MKTKDIRSMGLAYLEVLEGKKAVNKHGHDHVGQEDPDVNNDKKVDSTDKYLLNRRKAISANVRKEEVEELDELSKATLGKYIKLAGPDRERRQKSAEKLANVGHNIKSNDPEHAHKLFTKAGAEHLKAANRKTGINKAVNKLVGEETELDEISNEKKMAYGNAAFADYHKQSKAKLTNILTGKDSSGETRKMANRIKGISRSTKTEETKWPIFARIQEKMSLPSYKVSGIGDDPHEVTVNYAKDPHTKGATPPEKIDSTASGGEKDFIAKHGGLGGNESGINAHEYAAKNSVAHTSNVKVAPGRHNDQKIGDKAPLKSKS